MVCRIQGLSCQMVVVSRVCRIQCLSCPGFVVSSVCRVYCFSCPGFVVSSVCRVQCLSYPVFVVSRVCRVQCYPVKGLFVNCCRRYLCKISKSKLSLHTAQYIQFSYTGTEPVVYWEVFSFDNLKIYELSLVLITIVFKELIFPTSCQAGIFWNILGQTLRYTLRLVETVCIYGKAGFDTYRTLE
jgi:hypothetical protein